MIDRRQLLADLKPLVRAIEDDLRGRLPSNPDFRAGLEADWRAAHGAGRTAEDFGTWADAQFTQSAVGWVLACCFVRFCEDNGLIDEPLIAGGNGRGRSAAARQEAFYARQPLASDNDYLRDVFGTAGRLPGLAEVFRVQTPQLAAPVSADAAKRLVGFFRVRDADSGALRHDFADPDWNTRFLGDLYQDLSEAARDRYALLQTPEFVEEFILDRTLTPALDAYALEEVDCIDPTCGSGHFLLGALARLAPRWLDREPGNPNVAIQHALDRIAGIDLNPYAVAIARFRLLVAALKLAGVTRLRIAPDFHLRIAVGDSLLHGFDQRDHLRAQRSLGLDVPHQAAPHSAGRRGVGANGAARQAPTPATRSEVLAHLYNHAFASEDLRTANEILGHRYAAVVGNPPYITVKDRAVSALYRERYSSCHGKYALVAPFCERFWALGKPLDATQRGGFIGLIVSDSFMKREFGKKLVEDFFPGHDLTHVISTAVANIPGHGTTTAILLGRARPPAAGVVRAVMGIRGEPETPADPAQGVVWQAILNQIDVKDSESEWVSVSDVPRETLARHPWSMGGGGAAELKEMIEVHAAFALEKLIARRAVIVQIGDRTVTREVIESGFASFSGADEVFLGPAATFLRNGVPPALIRPSVLGESVRDWTIEANDDALVPYDKSNFLIPFALDEKWYRFLWRFRTTLAGIVSFNNQTKSELGAPWWGWYRWIRERYLNPLTITYGEVATHNHFVLDRGGKVFKQTAPVIKLPDTATEDDHLGLLGLLNSSTACFWFQQVCHNKGGPGGGSSKDEKWHDFYALNGTKIGQFPVLAERPTGMARTLEGLARERSAQLPSALLAQGVPSRAALDAARAATESLRRRMIAWQEELDWWSYRHYGVLGEQLTYGKEPPEVALGQRPFEIVLARDVAARRAETRWFEWLGIAPYREIPSHWPRDYQELTLQRIEIIERNRDVRLIENMNCKRRWEAPAWDQLERGALEDWLLDRLEGADLWPRDASPAPRLLSPRDLAEALAHDEEFRRALDLYAGAGSDAGAAVAALLRASSVPFLDALRYTESGARKRAAWYQTWTLQRREDAIDAEVAAEFGLRGPGALTPGPPRQAQGGLSPGGRGEEVVVEQRRRRAAEVGAIPVPPRYRPEDFRGGVFWRLRGALDVPKERFVSFPGLERARDAGLPLVLWAGYDAKARALALTTHLYDLQQREGADAARLAPALAGLDELLPWVHQWHPEEDPDLGTTTGDYLQGLLDAQLAQHGLTLAEVRAWAPTAAPRARRRRAG